MTPIHHRAPTISRIRREIAEMMLCGLPITVKSTEVRKTTYDPSRKRWVLCLETNDPHLKYHAETSLPQSGYYQTRKAAAAAINEMRANLIDLVAVNHLPDMYPPPESETPFGPIMWEMIRREASARLSDSDYRGWTVEELEQELENASLALAEYQAR